MIQGGQIVLFKFPQVNQAIGKLRPALVICRLPGKYDDWLICMISSQLVQQVAEFDEIIYENDEDFKQSGLKTSSLIRISRLAIISKDILLGSIGDISTDRLYRIKNKLSTWITSR